MTLNRLSNATEFWKPVNALCIYNKNLGLTFVRIVYYRRYRYTCDRVCVIDAYSIIYKNAERRLADFFSTRPSSVAENSGEKKFSDKKSYKGRAFYFFQANSMQNSGNVLILDA